MGFSIFQIHANFYCLWFLYFYILCYLLYFNLYVFSICKCVPDFCYQFLTGFFHFAVVICDIYLSFSFCWFRITFQLSASSSTKYVRIDRVTFPFPTFVLFLSSFSDSCLGRFACVPVVIIFCIQIFQVVLSLILVSLSLMVFSIFNLGKDFTIYLMY